MNLKTKVLLKSGCMEVKLKKLSINPQVNDYYIEDRIIEEGRENKVIIGVIPGELPWYYIKKEKQGFVESRCAFKGVKPVYIKSKADYYFGFGKNRNGNYEAELTISEEHFIKRGILLGHELKEVDKNYIMINIMGLVNLERFQSLVLILNDVKETNVILTHIWHTFN